MRVVYFLLCFTCSSLKLRELQTSTQAEKGNPFSIPGLNSHDAASNLLWMQYKMLCSTTLLGLPPPPMNVGPFTMWAWRNHGLCYESENLSDFCTCHWREPRTDFLVIDNTIEKGFNRTRWTLVSGHHCNALKFTAPGHSRAKHLDESTPPFHDCPGKHWETQVRRDWFTFRFEWQGYLDGTWDWATFQKNIGSDKHWIFPANMRDIDMHLMATPQELSEFIAPIFQQIYCNLTDLDGNPYGDCGAGQPIQAENIDIAICPLSPTTGIVRDIIFAYNLKIGRDPTKNPPTQSGVYEMVLEEATGLYKIGLLHLGNNMSGPIPTEWMLECNHYKDPNNLQWHP